MKINSIHIQNFRKLQSCKIDFSEKETIFVGANNSGKTTAMDALMIFLKTKNFKTQDFTLCHWKNLNEVGENWIKTDDLKEEDKSVKLLEQYLPILDSSLCKPYNSYFRLERRLIRYKTTIRT
jgi:predicted ATP-dependent endonuclease of OLD family